MTGNNDSPESGNKREDWVEGLRSMTCSIPEFAFPYVG